MSRIHDKHKPAHFSLISAYKRQIGDSRFEFLLFEAKTNMLVLISLLLYLRDSKTQLWVFKMLFILKVLVIFTDGAQTQRPGIPVEEWINPGDNAQKLKDKNVTIYAIGAASPDPVELDKMATGPSNFFFADLKNLAASVDKIINELCKIEITVSLLLFLNF